MPVRDPSSAGGALGAIRRLLPQGRALSDRQWFLRHQTMLTLLWLHAVGLFLYAVLQGFTVLHSAGEVSLLVAAALVASYKPLSRSVLSSVCAFGLVLSSAILVHLSGGQVEMHFHFFVVVALVTMYQAPAPFGVAILFVLLHHGILGTVSPESVYNHRAAWENPWLWALVHASFIGAAALVGLATWKANESLMVELERTASQTRLVLDSAAEGVVGVNASGVVTFANRSAQRLLGITLGGSVHHSSFLPCTEDSSCPVCSTLRFGEVRREGAYELSGVSGPVPVSLVVSPVVESGRVEGAVLTFHDLTEREQLRLAELEVRRLSERESAQRAEVLALQDTLRPRIPLVEGVDLGVHYVPAAGAPVGGDFYDWVVLPSGELHLAVVDVLGKGLTATKDALAVVHTLRTLSLEGVALGDLVERSDVILTEQSPDLIATLLVARYTPATGRLLLAGASHPPALIVSPDGTVEEVEAPGLAVGYPDPGSFEVVERFLEEGSSLVMYTDGLVEGTRDVLEGLLRLSEAASASRSLAAHPLAAHLVTQSLERADRSDDSLALVLRRGQASAVFEDRIALSEPRAARRARKAVEEWLRENGAASAADDLGLVVSELATNALTATRSAGRDRPVIVRAWFDGGCCVLQVRDQGAGGMVLSADPTLPDLDAEGGRGLYISRMVCEWVEVRSEPAGTLVEVAYRLGEPQEDLSPAPLTAIE